MGETTNKIFSYCFTILDWCMEGYFLNGSMDSIKINIEQTRCRISYARIIMDFLNIFSLSSCNDKTSPCFPKDIWSVPSYHFLSPDASHFSFCQLCNLLLLKMSHDLLTMIANRCSRVTRKYTRGCYPQTLPTWPLLVQPVFIRGQTNNNICMQSQRTRIQSQTLSLCGTNTACCKLPTQEMVHPYSLGRPLGITKP